MARVDEALELLAQLDALLQSESEALRALDFAAIEFASQNKEALEPRLQEAMTALQGQGVSDDERARLSALRTSIRERGKANLARMQATLGSMRDLVSALTGIDERQTYNAKGGRGYGRAATAQAVLTREIG